MTPDDKDTEIERLKKIEAMYHDLFHQWNEDHEPDCSSFGHSEHCKAIDLGEAKRALQSQLTLANQRIAELENDNEALRDDKDASAKRFNRDQERIEKLREAVALLGQDGPWGQGDAVTRTELAFLHLAQDDNLAGKQLIYECSCGRKYPSPQGVAECE